jgi:two-component system response regulator (stage 0 sporulation protein F)
MDSKHVNILVVDDDEATRVYVAKILSLKNWQVDTAEDGLASLDLVQKKAYDVVVLDYRMPGMDGVELCRRIRQIQPAVREVFLTGFPSIDTVYPAIEAGADHVLAKPVDPAELLQVLEEELARAV